MANLLKYPGESSNDDLTPEGKAAAHSRRVFLFKLALVLNGDIGALLAVPLIGFLLAPVQRRNSAPGSWVSLGSADNFPVGQISLANFQSPVAGLGDGDTANVACWVRRVSDQQFQVFAVNCAHLGCPVRWFAQSKLFLCPCHGGAYYQDGSRAAGPPERGLFEYRSKLDNNSLLIHAGNMPTLSTHASCGKGLLIQIKRQAT
jgi:Rieske Fe-S protein